MTHVRRAIVELLKSEMLKVEEGVVLSISENNRTFSAKIDDDLEVSNIRLTAIIDDNAENFIVNYPKVGSDVLIAEYFQGAWIVILMSEIQKIHIKNSDFELVIENGVTKMITQELQINGGKNKGLVKVEPLEQLLTDMINWMKSIDTVIRNNQVSTSAMGSPDLLQIALKAAVTTNKVPSITNLENDKIKH